MRFEFVSDTKQAIWILTIACYEPDGCLNRAASLCQPRSSSPGGSSNSAASLYQPGLLPSSFRTTSPAPAMCISLPSAQGPLRELLPQWPDPAQYGEVQGNTILLC